MNTDKSTNHLMLDLETLGVTPGSVILAIGAVVFDPYQGKVIARFSKNIQTEPQLQLGMTKDAATQAWWDNPARAEAKKHLENPAPVPPLAALQGLHSLCRDYDCGPVWGHGATFDVSLLDALFRRFDFLPPWKFYDARDTRTLFALTGTEVKRSVGLHHNAVIDALRQAEAVCEAYHALGKTEHGLLRRFAMAHHKANYGTFYDWSEK